MSTPYDFSDTPPCPAGEKWQLFCPLYAESHAARGLGCVDDLARPCRVRRGEMNFQVSILALAAQGIAHPGMLQMLNTVGGRQ